MDQLMMENRPEVCAPLGLDCGTCMHNAASGVASICRSLDPQGLQQIFFQMYPSPACRPMAAAFELAYREVAAPKAVAALASAVAA